MFSSLTFDQSYDILLFMGAFFLAMGSFYQWAWKPFIKGDEERAHRIADKAAENAVEPLVAKLDDIVSTVNTVKGEVQTNGGKSLKDVVLDTREKQAELAARFDQHMQEANHG
jgi:F0F1-type ATP synthase membrane subunit b/b'